MPLGPPTNATVSLLRQAGVVGDHPGSGVQHDVGGLERLHPAGEDEHDAVLRQAELVAGVRLRPRPEHRQVDARVDGGDARRVGAVVPDELAGLVVGVGHQAVCRRDHLGLAAQPDVRLGGVARGERGVLDLAQRVHGLDQRHSPSLLGDGAYLAREPVVAVHQVVAARRVRGLGPEQLERELA